MLEMVEYDLIIFINDATFQWRSPVFFWNDWIIL